MFLALLSRIWLGLLCLAALFFPGILLAVALTPDGASHAVETLLSLIGGGVSYFFWRGVRSTDAGRRTVDWLISFGLRE